MSLAPMHGVLICPISGMVPFPSCGPRTLERWVMPSEAQLPGTWRLHTCPTDTRGGSSWLWIGLDPAARKEERVHHQEAKSDHWEGLEGTYPHPSSYQNGTHKPSP